MYGRVFDGFTVFNRVYSDRSLRSMGGSLPGSSFGSQASLMSAQPLTMRPSFEQRLETLFHSTTPSKQSVIFHYRSPHSSHLFKCMTFAVSTRCQLGYRCEMKTCSPLLSGAFPFVSSIRRNGVMRLLEFILLLSLSG